ncbi:hypothetical protein BGW42_006655 [Actinomortierella wolfii]|nr:hypothetical protein BGW42_006655 [Actinomortierella wolfii]
MGACCGKPERKEGYVLGGINSSSSQPSKIQETKASGTKNAHGQSQGQGHVLGGSAPKPPAGGDSGLSPSALAAQKRAEAAANRGVQAGGGKLAKKLAEQRGKSHHEPEDKLPEHAGSQWN